jgi:hypothetical protein
MTPAIESAGKPRFAAFIADPPSWSGEVRHGRKHWPMWIGSGSIELWGYPHSRVGPPAR